MMREVVFKTPTVNVMHTPEYKAYMKAGKEANDAMGEYLRAHTNWIYERSIANEVERDFRLEIAQRRREVANKAGEALDERRTIRRHYVDKNTSAC